MGYLGEFQQFDPTFVYVENYEKANIPDKWKRVLLTKDKTQKVNLTIEIWKNGFSKKLSNVLNYMSRNLIDCELIKNKEQYYIVYILQHPTSETIYYLGGLDSNNTNLETLPNDLKEFYQEVHNGFYFFPGKFMGLQEIKDVEVMSEYDWGVISDLDIHIDFNLDDYIIIFATGMGGYIVVKAHNDNSNAIIWFDDDEPIYDENIWDILDEWLYLGFTE
ncbi:SMI1/KNR4 family protein [Staphylococcus warneri]|uniref:SMI1/KNR4 family protein n=1 Tax=Staphylococcus warneri TaxID=1292 RepID=UPI003261BBD8